MRNCFTRHFVSLRRKIKWMISGINFTQFLFELVVTVADETDVKEARSFSSAWRKSNEPAAKRRKHAARTAGWIQIKISLFTLAASKRGHAHNFIYIYTYPNTINGERKERNG